MRRETRSFLVLGALLLGVVSAATAGEPPPGVPTAQMSGYPPPGTKWTLMTTSEAGVTRRTPWTVLPEGERRGQPVYRVSNGNETIALDRATLNFVARLDGEGRPVYAISPHDGQFSWPLWVGKRWTAKFEAVDFLRNRTFKDVEAQWAVEAYEPLTVPAGTFPTFRLQSIPLRHQMVARTLWYAPDLRIVVKIVSEMRAGGAVLERSVTELAELTPAP